jgi:F420-non-reducing hydrogenase small subunit
MAATNQTPQRPQVTINTEWLSDCAGCHVAIVDVHEKLLNILEAVTIQRCPVLTDVKDYPHADIGLVSGAIRTEHDRHAAQAMRASCDTIIAWGSCAVYGGIAGAGIVHTTEEIFETVYENNKTTTPHAPPHREVSPLEAVVKPIDEVIGVDLYLPGCPPHAGFIFDALISLVEGREPKATRESVCARCKRVMKKTEVDVLKMDSEGVPETETCFLSQGYLCMGSVTLDRCMSPCPTNGMMCTGCAGATMQVLTEPNRDIRTEIADRMSRLTHIPRETIIKKIEHSSKTHYSYTMASKMIGQKPTFLIKKWIKDAESEYE